MNNGEQVHRYWLVYSKSTDKAFCFCCKLYGNDTGSQLANEGYSDWAHLGRAFDNHEKSAIHGQNVGKGSNSKLYEPNNSNFLGLIEMMATFDPVMQEHLRQIRSSEIHDHHLGANIQNELIKLSSEKVKEEIVSNINAAKYFSVLLDCTPDLSHQEQLSFVIRFVKTENNVSATKNESEGMTVEEHFLEFLDVKSTTGKNLTDVLLEELDKIGLGIKDRRGQGYDNGSNMKGSYSGVQARILEINPKAFYIPCESHSLNLLICDAAKCSHKAITFFGIIKEVHDALDEVAEATDDPKAKSKARSLVNEIRSYEFLVALAIWYDVLFVVNSVSKNLQAEKMHLGIASQLLQGLAQFFEQFRKEGFLAAIMVAREMGELLDIEPKFQIVKQRKKRKMFDYEGEDDEKELKSIEQGQLLEKCKALEASLSFEGQKDICGNDLFTELKVLRDLLPAKVETAAGTTKFVGKLTLNVDDSGELITHDGEMIYLDNKYPERKEADDLVSRIKGFEIAETTVFLNGRCAKWECNLGNLITDALVNYKVNTYDGRYYSDTSIALVAAKNIKSNIELTSYNGLILFEDLLYVINPHRQLVTIEIKGSALKRTLYISLEKATPENERTTISETHVPETQTKSAASVPQSQTNVYTITHVSSFDGVYDPVLTREGYRVGGLSRIVQYRTNKIFLLTGNLIRKSFASNRPNRLYVDQDILKFLAPDVFTLGEAEFQLLPEYYTFLKENTRIKVGCVNTNLESFAERMVKIKNTNIVVIGYIPTTFEGYVLATMEKLRVTDAIQAMRKQISDYNDNALFVAAGCAGIDFAIKIAEEVEGIDIVISGCSAHMQWNDGEPPESIPKYSDYPLRVTGKGGKSVLVAHSYGTTKFIGDLKVTVDSLGNVLNSTGNMVYLDHNYPENENMNAIVNQIRKVELARTRVFLNGKCNTKECNLGNVVADAFVMYKSELYTGEHWTDTPIGLVLSRNLRNNINASKTEDIILIDNVLYLFKPHHRLVTINVLGRDLLKVLEASIEQSEEYLAIISQCITEVTDRGRQIEAIYADPSEAIDLIDQEILLHKLDEFGFVPTTLKIVRAYLSQRACHLIYNGYFSDEFTTIGLQAGSADGCPVY
ncbi:hypothetical protein Trydic_g7605 [Trypoxylus dichotomus]